MEITYVDRRAGFTQVITWRYPNSVKGNIWGFDNVGGSFGARSEGRGSWFYIAPDGRSFDTLRDLFAGFRMRLAPCEWQVNPLEQLRTALGVIESDLHVTNLDAAITRAFDGSTSYFESYVHWLHVEGFVERSGPGVACIALSVEGDAVLRMLNATAVGSNLDMSPRAAIAKLKDERGDGKGFRPLRG